MKIKEQVSLAEYTTLQVGGPARYFCSVRTLEDLESARQFALQTCAPILPLGSGSNLLVTEAGFPGLVIHNQILGRSYQTDDGRVVASFGAGEMLDNVIAETVTKNLWGLENLSHIPGTVGATPVQNVGAYGVEVADLITGVTAFSLISGEIKTFSNDECRFEYRDSFFKTEAGKQWFITMVSVSLSPDPRPVLGYKDLQPLSKEAALSQAVVRDTVIAIRGKKFPDWHTVGTAGSFFKNPIIATEQAEELKAAFPDLPTYPVADGLVKVSLGYILDQVCGLKGYENAGVKLYENQALVLVNQGESASAVQAFAQEVVQIVKDKTGITIEQEVTTV